MAFVSTTPELTHFFTNFGPEVLYYQVPGCFVLFTTSDPGQFVLLDSGRRETV
jgi:hypothetical protein